MGVFSIILGIITFACFTGGGAILSNVVINKKTELAEHIVDLNNVSNAPITIAIILIFAFIGILIGMNLIMHGLTFRKRRTGGTSMGTIAILLGVCSLCLFILCGLFFSNFIVKYKNILAMAGTLSFLTTVSETLVFEVVISLFTFIGLLICTNQVMHGLNYKRVAKLQNQLKRSKG